MTINCNGCRACCISDRIFLGPHDDPLAYQWHVENGYAVLDRKTNGECIYLTETGCGIHDAAPAICKRFDCRELVKRTPAGQQTIRVHQNHSMAAVYAAGLARLT